MLFAKKTVEPKKDPHLAALEDARWDARVSLEAAVKRAIIKQGVISLYPDGPDKDAAQKEFEAAKRFLLCSIGAYDARVQELSYYINGHKLGRVIPPTSHMIIEEAYEKFYKNA